MNARLQDAEGVIVSEREDNERVVGMNRGGDELEYRALGDAGASDVTRDFGNRGHGAGLVIAELPPALAIRVQRVLSLPVAFFSCLRFGSARSGITSFFTRSKAVS